MPKCQTVEAIGGKATEKENKSLYSCGEENEDRGEKKI